jgi:uncharacterized protein (DUF58 family)
MLRRAINKWVFLLVIMDLSLIMGLRTSIQPFFFFFWFLVCTVLISLAWVALEYAALDLALARESAGKAEEDDNLPIEARVRNNGPLPVFNLVVVDRLPCAGPPQFRKALLVDFLPAAASINLHYGCPCPKRGRYRLGPFEAYLFDPLGLVFLKKNFKVYSDLYVYPKTFNIQKFPPLRKGVLPWFGIESARSISDEDEFYGVREYRGGDPIKKIHWFSTARNNKLIVRQFQRQVFFRATIMFNLERDKNFGEGKDTVAENIIKLAASVAKYLVDNDVAVEIIAHTEETVHIPFNKGLQHLENVFKFLSIAQPESRVGLGEIFEDFSHYIPDDSTLIVIMLDKDWEYLPAMLPLGKRNVSLIPLILLSSTFMYSFDKREVIQDVKIKLTQAFNFTPMVFSRGDVFEESFHG